MAAGLAGAWMGCGSSSPRLAFIVANSDYLHAAPLPNPRNDAKAVAAELAEAGWTVETAIDRPASELRALLRERSAATRPRGKVILYYAGHGMQIDGANYLVPIDFDPEDARPTDDLITLDEVMAAFKGPENQLAVFLDACRDNPLAAALERELAERSRGLQVVEKRERRIGRGLAEVATESGTFIAFATEPGNVALDGDGAHSPFADALIGHIGTPDRDIGWIMKRVRAQVIESTGGHQIPWDHSSLTRDFEIRSESTAPPPP